MGGPQNLEPFLLTFPAQDRAPCQVPLGSGCRGPALRKPASLGLEVCLRLPLGFDSEDDMNMMVNGYDYLLQK